MLFPEIPCSFDAGWADKQAFKTCVEEALDELVAAGVLPVNQQGRFLASALRAFEEQ